LPTEIVKLLTGQDGIAQSRIGYIANREVYLMDYDGYGNRAFTRDNSIKPLPLPFRPDGSDSPMSAYRGGFPNVVIRGEDGLIIGATQFKGHDNLPFDCSPDGQIVFSSSKDGSGMDLYIASGDGSGAKRLTNSQKSRQYFAALESERPGSRSPSSPIVVGNPQIYLVGADGTNERPLLTLGGQMGSPGLVTGWKVSGLYLGWRRREISTSTSPISPPGRCCG
jgi:TolB protein